MDADGDISLLHPAWLLAKDPTISITIHLVGKFPIMTSWQACASTPTNCINSDAGHWVLPDAMWSAVSIFEELLSTFIEYGPSDLSKKIVVK